MPYSYVDVESIEGEGPGGAVRKVRRELGAQAFGFNYFTLSAGRRGSRARPRRAESGGGLFFVVRGGGVMRIDGEEIQLKPGRFVRVDPSSTRMPVAGDEGLEFVTFGAPIGGGYEPPSWG